MSAQELRLWPSLTICVRHAQPQLEPLGHVLEQISHYIRDYSARWSLESASEAGFAYALDFLAKREWSGVQDLTPFRVARFKNGLKIAASQGHVDVLQWWIQRYLPGQLIPFLIVQLAASNGHLSILQWLHKHKMMPRAPVHGHLSAVTVTSDKAEIVYWLRKHNHEYGFRLKYSMDQIAALGDLALLQWLHMHKHTYDIECSPIAIHQAALQGHLPALQWLLKTYPTLLFGSAFKAAASGGHLKTMRWLVTQYPNEVFQQPNHDAVINGHVHVVQWLVEQFQWKTPVYRMSWLNAALQYAASCGHFTLVKYFYGHVRQPLDLRTQNDVLNAAAMAGHLEMVQWLCARGADRYMLGTLDYAAQNGHLDVLKWVYDRDRRARCMLLPKRSRGCSQYVMDFAARDNHLEVAQWLHRNLAAGCTKKAMNDAAANGHLEMVKWLHKHIWSGGTTQAMDRAAENGHLQVVQFLHAHRKESGTSRSVDGAAANGHFEVVQWLVLQWFLQKRGPGLTTISIEASVMQGHGKVVRFLVRHCGLKCSAVAAMEALRKGHFAVVEWLLKYDAENGTRRLRTLLFPSF